MFHVLLLRYTSSLAEADSHVAGHVAHLERYHARGVFGLSGQIGPGQDGEVVLALGERSRIEEIAAEDPLVQAGIATYEIVSATSERAHPALEELFGESASANEGPATSGAWATDEYRRLRAAGTDLASLLHGRPLGAVLQRAGDALLGGLRAGAPPGVAEEAQRCVQGLRERGWEGDGLLADALAHALGEPHADAEPLTPIPVDLEALAEALDGDPNEGESALDLGSGFVWPAMAFDDGLPPEMDEAEGDGEDLADHLLMFLPGSGAAYRDMVDFAETVTDPGLCGRLLRALEGRGAFRRFKDAIHDAPQSELDAWTIFRDERAVGRARRWLADEGYRPTETGRPG